MWGGAENDMQWYMIFLVGALTGMIVLLLFGQDPQITVSLPEIRWTIDTTKYLFSIFVATIMMMFMFWYFA